MPVTVPLTGVSAVPPSVTAGLAVQVLAAQSPVPKMVTDVGTPVLEYDVSTELMTGAALLAAENANASKPAKRAVFFIEYPLRPVGTALPT